MEGQGCIRDVGYVITMLHCIINLKFEHASHHPHRYEMCVCLCVCGCVCLSVWEYGCWWVSVSVCLCGCVGVCPTIFISIVSHGGCVGVCGCVVEGWRKQPLLRYERVGAQWYLSETESARGCDIFYKC